MGKLMANTKQRLVIAAGANLPYQGQEATVTLRQAFAALSKALPGLQVSPFYSTPCFPAGAGPDYVNAACAADIPAGLAAADVLALLHEIEARFGRTRETRWGMRTLDLDLIAFGNAVLPDVATQDDWRGLSPERQSRIAPDRLILPHPRLQDRAFVLVPMADVAPDWVHPRLGLDVMALLAALPAKDRQQVVRIVD